MKYRYDKAEGIDPVHRIIDFDDPCSFPVSLRNWDNDFENKICRIIDSKKVAKGWQIERQLQDMHIDEMPIVTNFVSANLDTEIAGYHVTRILDRNSILTEGLKIGGGRGSIAEKRLKDLLKSIDLPCDRTNEIFTHIYQLWDRDKKQRTESVHFVLSKRHIYEDDSINIFAINLGGEILRWSLQEIDSNLYKEEPYKRLWIKGTPSIVKFKYKLSEAHECCRNSLIAEIVKYHIVKQKYGYTYKFDFTGMTTGSVPPQNIISIEEITGFIKIQEKYSEYNGFYDELK